MRIYEVAVSLSERYGRKRLCAIGNDKFYYGGTGVSTGAMQELTTTLVAGQSSGPIVTTDQLNMFELYQKVFVVNGGNLRVADFVNVKLTSDAEITTHLPSHGDILRQIQNGDDIAYMVVDYVSAWYATGSKHLIYGYAYYAGDATVFLTNKNIIDKDDNVVIALDHIAKAEKPHWYDWTPYNGQANDDAYGKLPNKAYLGCAWRGRAVISGNPEHPHQWYMSRQGHPFDFVYTSTDAQSAVMGGNADIGKIGEIVLALAPVNRDYLIMGCASTVWLMEGDPMQGGNLNVIDDTTGIYGAKSWCLAGKYGFFFWGANGIYQIELPNRVTCISEIKLPELIADRDADPSTHRITMAYDITRGGIVITITRVADGNNFNYWLDLRTGKFGLFPESYPEECAAYSMLFYHANDKDFRHLLVGGFDGYIRKFNNSAKDDVLGDGDPVEAISSHITLGPIALGDEPGKEGIINNLSFETAGGASGSGNDSDAVVAKIWAENSAAKVLEKFAANTGPAFSKTIAAPGRRHGDIIRRKVKGRYGGVRLHNTTEGETWAFEQLLIFGKPKGRHK